jgi:hypothetical protein
VSTAAELSVDRLADELESWHRWAAVGGARPQHRPPPGHVESSG